MKSLPYFVRNASMGAAALYILSMSACMDGVTIAKIQRGSKCAAAMNANIGIQKSAMFSQNSRHSARSVTGNVTVTNFSARSPLRALARRMRPYAAMTSAFRRSESRRPYMRCCVSARSPHTCRSIPGTRAASGDSRRFSISPTMRSSSSHVAAFAFSKVFRFMSHAAMRPSRAHGSLLPCRLRR